MAESTSEDRKRDLTALRRRFVARVFRLAEEAWADLEASDRALDRLAASDDQGEVDPQLYGTEDQG